MQDERVVKNSLVAGWFEHEMDILLRQGFRLTTSMSRCWIGPDQSKVRKLRTRESQLGKDSEVFVGQASHEMCVPAETLDDGFLADGVFSDSIDPKWSDRRRCSRHGARDASWQLL